jgi:hypothetical protein
MRIVRVGDTLLLVAGGWELATDRGMENPMGRLKKLVVTTLFACLLVPAASSAATCPEPEGRPFLRWLDLAQYGLAPGGDLERAAGWTLSGGAKLVRGNESFMVHSARDVSSLSLPTGSSATTAPFCVGIEHPTIRFFARNGGSLLSLLKVEVLFEDVLGTRRALPVGVAVGGSRWQPSLPMPLLLNVLEPVLALDLNAAATVQLRFTPVGQGSGWQIDDLYVDPFRGR